MSLRRSLGGGRDGRCHGNAAPHPVSPFQRHLSSGLVANVATSQSWRWSRWPLSWKRHPAPDITVQNAIYRAFWLLTAERHGPGGSSWWWFHSYFAWHGDKDVFTTAWNSSRLRAHLHLSPGLIWFHPWLHSAHSLFGRMCPKIVDSIVDRIQLIRDSESKIQIFRYQPSRLYLRVVDFRSERAAMMRGVIPRVESATYRPLPSIQTHFLLGNEWRNCMCNRSTCEWAVGGGWTTPSMEPSGQHGGIGSQLKPWSWSGVSDMPSGGGWGNCLSHSTGWQELGSAVWKQWSGTDHLKRLAVWPRDLVTSRAVVLLVWRQLRFLAGQTKRNKEKRWSHWRANSWFSAWFLSFEGDMACFLWRRALGAVAAVAAVAAAPVAGAVAAPLKWNEWHLSAHRTGVQRSFASGIPAIEVIFVVASLHCGHRGWWWKVSMEPGPHCLASAIHREPETGSESTAWIIDYRPIQDECRHWFEGLCRRGGGGGGVHGPSFGPVEMDPAPSLRPGSDVFLRTVPCGQSARQPQLRHRGHDNQPLVTIPHHPASTR